MNIKKAEDLIHNKGKVLILLDIENMSHYGKIISKVIDNRYGWNLGIVNMIDVMEERKSNNKPPLYFEPDKLPTLFVYTHSTRRVVVERILEEQELITLLDEIDNDTFELS